MKYLIALAAAAASIAIAAPSQAVTPTTHVASRPWANITTSAEGIHFHLSSTAPTAWMVTADNKVRFYGIEDSETAVPVRFAGHTGSHVVRVYQNGVEVFHQTLRTGVAHR